MSGVIMDGVQYEQCNGCGHHISISKLYNEPPSPAHPIGRTLCSRCKFDADKQTLLDQLKQVAPIISQPISAEACTFGKLLDADIYEPYKEIFPNLDDGFVAQYHVCYHPEHQFPIPLYAMRSGRTIQFYKQVSQKWS
jgi:hypothetical protein